MNTSSPSAGKHSYVIIHESRLILCYIQGHIEIADLIQLNTHFINDPDFDPDFDILMDFRASLAIAYGMEMKDFFNFLTHSIRLKKKIKNGLLLNTPNQKYLLNIFKALARLINIEARDFNNLTDCLIWMGYSESEQIVINNALSELKKN